MMTTHKEIEDLIVKSGDVIRDIRPALCGNCSDILFEFWQRFLDNNKAILILLNNGLVGEAMAIQRLSIENFANTIALILGEVTPEQLDNQAEAAIQDVMKKQEELDKQEKWLTVENREKVRSFLEESEQDSKKNSGLSTYNTLGSCGLNFMYQAKYRVLSIRAAHSTLNSALLGKKIKQDPAFAEAESQEILTTASELLTLTIAFAQEQARKLPSSAQQYNKR